MANLLLAPPDRDRLVRCLRLLSSDHAGERDAAGLAAQRIVSHAGLDWGELIATGPVLQRPPDPPPPPAGWRVDVQRCLRRPDLLTPWEAQFLESIADLRRPSLKQLVVLSRIVAKVRRP